MKKESNPTSLMINEWESSLRVVEANRRRGHQHHRHLEIKTVVN